MKSNKEEALTTHADHFNTNYAYKVASYMKGSMFLVQLGYITGEETRNKILLEYYRLWKFRHPDVNDFIRIAGKSKRYETRLVPAILDQFYPYDRLCL
ncbi:MAG: hypothetical protein WDN26_00695 [Chitinophagaceae bacterium]